jgi:predicted permease
MRLAVRQLLKSPGFTLVALLTLALGIGVNSTTFSLVNALLYRLPGFHDPWSLVEIFGTLPQDQTATQSPANARDEMHQASDFEQMSVWCFASPSLSRPGEPARRMAGLSVSGNYFTTLGIAPLLGRAFTPEDEGPGHSDVVVVSEKFWREFLGASAQSVGSVLRVDGKPVTVVGVMPQAAQDPLAWGPVDLWQPVGYAADGWQIRNNDWLNIMGRLKPGVSVREAQAQMSTIMARLARDYPDVDAKHGANLMPYVTARSFGARRIVYVVMGLMLFVLLIACVNLANLQLARTAARTREHAIRIALGASRVQMIRQLLAESVVLSVVGGALGVLVALWGNRLLGSRITISNVEGYAGFALPMDARVLCFTTLASLATGVVFGIMPGWIASRTDVNLSLKQSGRGSSGDRSKHRLRQALVVGEVALALALLTGAGFFVRGVQRTAGIDPGWDSHGVVGGSFVLSYNTYKDNDQVRTAVNKLTAAIDAIPGVDHAAITGSIPIFSFSHRGTFVVEGQATEHGQEPLAALERVTPGYFSTLGINVLSGRDFTDADRPASKQVVVINRSMAARFFPHGDAIGHRIGDADPKNPSWREIVGIVDDISLPGNPGVQATPYQAYRPFSQDPEHWLAFVARGRADPSSLASAARKAVMAVDHDLALSGLGTVDSQLQLALANMKLIGNLLAFAAALGLFLALVGIYGVVANLAAQRTQEIGIRMALGASNSAVLWMVLRNGGTLAALGTSIGLALAFAINRGLTLAVPFVPGSDPLLIMELACLIVAATLLASWLPARRATRVNPVEALRSE